MATVIIFANDDILVFGDDVEGTQDRKGMLRELLPGLLALPPESVQWWAGRGTLSRDDIIVPVPREFAVALHEHDVAETVRLLMAAVREYREKNNAAEPST